MALHYFIDGYNLIRSTHRWDNESKINKHLQLIRFLEEEKPTGSPRNSVTLVFDGHFSNAGTLRSQFVYIIFSGDQDADTIIKQRVDALPYPKEAVVVTNDRAIQKWVQGAGAKVVSCENFLRMAKRDRRVAGSEKPDSHSALSLNEELERIWKMK